MKSKLCAYTEETNLVEITEGGTVFQLHADAAASWEGMKQAARADGIDIYIVSAFRSIARQAQIIELKRARGLSDQEIFRVNTPPGFSEHHTGRALDLNSPGFAAVEVEFEISPAFQWLRQNANRFHFYLSYPENNEFGMIYEPWHWFYNPKNQTSKYAIVGGSSFMNNTKAKNTICIWFDKDAQDAANFYAATFPDSKVTAIHKAPGDFPGGKEGEILTVEFTVLGIPCIGINGGPRFTHSEAFSFQIATDTQEETDRYWNAIVGNGGEESACGWCKDRWGISWQITPRVLTDAMAAGGAEARRAFHAMMEMGKIDIAKIEAARRG